jgi:exportin-T
MTQCLGSKVLPYTPSFLELHIAHCNSEDIQIAAQMMNQRCIKFKQDAAPVLDAALLPFLRTCHNLMPGSENGEMPPHLRTEQLAIQKLTFVVLQHIVTHNATDTLVSPRNVGSFDDILQIMTEGTLNVDNPLIQKTCIQFFRELTDQWGEQSKKDANGIGRNYFCYLYECFCPSLFKYILSPSFDETDAMQARVLSEFGQLLSSVKSTRGDQEFPNLSFLAVCRIFGCPSNILTVFQAASNEKEFDLCLQEIMKVLKHNGYGQT